MKEHPKGSLGPQLDQLRFDIVNQAQDLLERIADMETRISRLESKLSFIVVRGDATDPELEFVGGD
jgi:hypothetical protein|tara:strand:+ start:1066 stop:1263 length:198 start_codon:yes stop_codon:yes gene_type:complete